MFVTHCPKELVPLAKQNPEDDSVVDVYELVINGQEISPGYSELNDPQVQRARLMEQAGEEKDFVMIVIEPRSGVVTTHRPS